MHAKTKKEQTALDLAKNRDIKNILVAYGADTHGSVQEVIANVGQEGDNQVSSANIEKEGVEPSPNLGQ